MKRPFVVLLGLLAVAIVSGTAGAGDNDSGFKTSQPAMLTPVASGASVAPIITVGDTVRGYRFEAIPDGISLDPNGSGTVDVYINHETSTVPFPYTPGAGAANQNDFDNSQVSLLRLNQHSAGVLKGELAITSAENFQRFCSNYLATTKEGFERSIFFTNEETSDSVNRSGVAFPPGPGAEQAGVVVATDVRSGTHKVIYGMGRLNHENDVAIAGYGHPVVLSGDDTFSSNPPSSQLYSYLADSARALWNDEGDLYGFVSDDPSVDDYYDFPVGSSMSVSGHFVKLDKSAATGDQNALETASDNAHVFQFVRLEDIAYDKRPGTSNVVYIADTGRGATSAGGNAFTSSNGRIWKLVLDPNDPTHVLSLSVLVEGDDNPVKTLSEIHQPDNVETTQSGLYITEDPGGSQQFPFGSIDAAATTARIWRYDLTTGGTAVVAKVDQSADEGPTDVDSSTTRGALGSWESSGIIDASSVFGPGAFLVNVQAHTLWIEQAGGPDWTYKREGGQLLLLRLPNA
jgi:Alkaline phosphatase PhoX